MGDGAGMLVENGGSEAHKVRAEREVSGMLKYLLLLALVSVVAVGGLSLLAWAVTRWYLAIATQLSLP